MGIAWHIVARRLRGLAGLGVHTRFRRGNRLSHPGFRALRLSIKRMFIVSEYFDLGMDRRLCCLPRIGLYLRI